MLFFIGLSLVFCQRKEKLMQSYSLAFCNNLVYNSVYGAATEDGDRSWSYVVLLVQTVTQVGIT